MDLILFLGNEPSLFKQYLLWQWGRCSGWRRGCSLTSCTQESAGNSSGSFGFWNIKPIILMKGVLYKISFKTSFLMKTNFSSLACIAGIFFGCKKVSFWKNEWCKTVNSIYSCNLWKNLPHQLKDLPNFSFQHLLKQYLLKRQFVNWP